MSGTTARHGAGAGARVGIDVGGTFTDFVLSHPADGRLVHYKEPSTPDDPARAVVRGLVTCAAKAGLAPGDVSLLLHGTTIGLNAIIQRAGARIGLVVTTGFRDILEIARSRMPSSFDFHARKEEPLVPRDRVFEIEARFDPKGQATRTPDADALDALAGAIRAARLDAVALVTVNGYAAPEAEGAIADALQARCPGVAVTSAARIWPEIREYERTLVACLNAYIQPLMQGYFARLASGLAEIGTGAQVFVTASNGGSMSLDSAVARPVETILSGPASGVMAAARLAGAAMTGTEVPAIITFDMGGTSSDIAVALDGEPEFATRTEVGGLPLVLPVVAVSAIGAGGGSIVWIDDHGVLKVGPRSAGAAPGPVAYGRGGREPAVTDAYLATGLIDPSRFLGGRMTLDRGAADAALAGIAARIGLDGAAPAAAGALAVATAGMATELFKTLAQRGLDPADFTLVPFGGAGPTHANLLAQEAGIARVVVPPAAGTFCALGAVSADLRRDFVRSLRTPLEAGSARRLAATFAALAGEGRAWLAEEGRFAGDVRLQRAADMRYAGQAYELRVGLDHLPDDAPETAFAEAFHLEHERVYGFRDASAPIQVTTLRLAVIGRTPALPLPHLPEAQGDPVPRGTRPVYLAGRWREAAVFDRATLAAGHAFAGPAVVEQEDTTVIVLPGWGAHLDRAGNLHLTRSAQA
ncbi:hydantoinase/oxoprolinase family protein [Methylobacterium currus]|uniref:hydantoinase/oxoprolinase family protein n=1 Tax=Methylobacterium currus TaxID=2051553 RepID=UPI001E375835|nr:hydantoinase/oxoprolinase family protein [Methylobacterium currus]UHC17916.1 hydantoinase/oxoprolinase family protein [Methylobacterium currus]